VESSPTENVYSVGRLHRSVRNAIAREFRGHVWVSAEIRNIREQRGSWFITMIDPGEYHDGSDVSLDVACWPKRRLVIEAQLRNAGLALTAGMHVRVRGNVTMSKLGRLQLELYDFDIEAMLGRQASEKRTLYAALEREDLLERNRRLPVPLVPLRIGLVTSEGSEGFNDFTGQLTRSPFAYSITLAHSPVQGPAAPAALASAIASLDDVDIDLVVVVRGGGGELDAFDKEPVVRAIATSRHPVWTGIGHTGDHAVADDVAQQHHITPTACGTAVVARVAEFTERVSSCARRVHRSAERLTQHEVVANANRLRHIRKAVERQLEIASSSLRATTGGLHREIDIGLRSHHDDLVAHARTINLTTRHVLERRAGELEILRVKTAALDPAVALRRGYTITRDGEGRVLRSVSDAEQAHDIRVQFVDGIVQTVVRT
jgi:exodeoxyribonuclease VII large subunit